MKSNLHKSMTSLVVCVLLMACGQRPAPVAQATGTASVSADAPAKIAAGPSGPRGGHDIAIKDFDGRLGFWNKATEKEFIPRGNNYIRLAEGVNHWGAPGHYYSLFSRGRFDQSAIEADLRLMRRLGYNTVRVFINTETPDGITDPKYGLSAEYLANVIKFLELADAYDLYVIITHDWLPVTEPYTSILPADDPNFGGANRIYLTSQGIEASKRFWTDLITALYETTATRRILAYEIQNEFYYDATEPPFSLSPLDPATGAPRLITAANGNTYDLRHPDHVQRLRDESMIYFLDAVTQAIKEYDPTALVTTGFGAPYEYDTREFAPYPAIEYSQLDFVGLHIYPFEYWDTPQEYLDRFGVNSGTTKPVVIGELGAFRGEFGRIPPTSEFRDNNEAADTLVSWQVASCKSGVDGWLTSTWDTNELTFFYSAAGDAGLGDEGVDLAVGPDRPDGSPPPLVDPDSGIVGHIAYRLSPLARPYPCYKGAVIVTPPISDPVLKITGKEEVVFDWTTDRCKDEHIPDLAARAFRVGTDQVQLITSHPINYRMVGPDLDHLTPDCKPIMQSDLDPDPSHYNDHEWIAAPYISDDGRTVYALVHNEYQGHTHSDRYPECDPVHDYFPCWYNSITLARSVDAGVTYQDALWYPNHRVASLPFQYEPHHGQYGIFSPSNIIRRNDGYYYAFVTSQTSPRELSNCLMRTLNLADPGAWRFWDGEGFNGQFINPYITTPDDPSDHLCKAIDEDNLGDMLTGSITYNTYLGRYLLVGLGGDNADGRWVAGIYYSISNDLVTWTHRKLLAEVPLPWTVEDGGADLSILYPTLLDPDSRSRNFETTDNHLYLYYTRHNFGQGSFDRDLIRVPVTVYASPEEAAAGP